MTQQPVRIAFADPRPPRDIETDDSLPSDQPGVGNPEANDFERSQEDVETDDPGDAQRASKSEPDGDGEEESR